MPAHNEEKAIIYAVMHTLETCKRAGIDFEIIIINDASSDNTGKLADELAAQHAVLFAVAPLASSTAL